MPDQSPTSIRIFRPGRHTSSSGKMIEFSRDDVAALVAGYDTEIHHAPLVKGHPKDDAPAFGWVDGLELDDDGNVLARFGDVDEAVRGEVGAGRFRHVSVSLYAPEDKHNPKPGHWHLRHVGLLGAVPPAIRGLGRASFSDDGAALDFATEGADSTIARALHAMAWLGDTVQRMVSRQREQEIERADIETADKIAPAHEADAIGSAVADIRAAADRIRADAPAFSEPAFSETETPTEEVPVSGDQEKTIEQLQAENAQLRSEQLARDVAAVHAGNVAFADALIGEAKLPQAKKDGLVALLDHLGAPEGAEAVSFSDGDGKAIEPIDALKSLLSDIKPAVTFGEVATGEESVAAVSFSVPQGEGYEVDPTAMALHARATAHAAANNVSYAEAVQAVSGS